MPVMKGICGANGYTNQRKNVAGDTPIGLLKKEIPAPGLPERGMWQAGAAGDVVPRSGNVADDTPRTCQQDPCCNS